MIRRLVVVAMLVSCGMAVAEPVEVSTAIEQTRTDIQSAVAELNQVRDEIARSRLPLASDHRRLQSEVARLREQLQESRQSQLQGASEIGRMQEEVQSYEQELQYLETSLLEFRRSLDARRGIAEARQINPALERIDAAWQPDTDYQELPEVASELITLAAERDKALRGGEIFAGSCLDPEGAEREGMFALFGPLGYFAATNDGPAGLVVTLPGSAFPSLWQAGDEDAARAIRALVSGEEATVPVDVTGGNALKVAGSGLSTLEQFQAGGFVMIPLVAVAALAILLAVWKFVGLVGIRIDSGDTVSAIVTDLKQGNIEEARDVAKGLTQPLASILEAGIEYRDVPREHLEDLLHERVLSSIPSLDRHLGILAVLGAVAPLLGLLGTVTGMIDTFQMVSLFGSGDANLLSGGISEALITTKFGLIIAVPVLLVHAYMARRVRTIVDALEHAALRFVNLLAMSRGEDG